MKMTRRKLAKAKKLAERLKKRPGVKNPHALSRAIVQRTVKKQKRRRK